MDTRSGLRLNLGCGGNAPEGWVNLDRSPGILVAKVPMLRSVLKAMGLLRGPQAEAVWPANARRWDVTKGLPYEAGSVDAIYSQYMLEHLPRKAAEDLISRVCTSASTVGPLANLGSRSPLVGGGLCGIAGRRGRRRVHAQRGAGAGTSTNRARTPGGRCLWGASPVGVRREVPLGPAASLGVRAGEGVRVPAGRVPRSRAGGTQQGRHLLGSSAMSGRFKRLEDNGGRSPKC